MDKKRPSVRKTVNLDAKLVSDCKVLMESLEVDSFSQYVTQALQKYNEEILFHMDEDGLTKRIRGTVRQELQPISTRVSRALYRYGVYIDILTSLISAYNFGVTDEQYKQLYRSANVRMQRSRGYIDMKALLNDDTPLYEDEEDY